MLRGATRERNIGQDAARRCRQSARSWRPAALTTKAIARYSARFRRVLDYLDRHLEHDVTVEQLAAVAAFSKFHFHRQFSGLFGLGVYEVIQLGRLKRASYRLAFRRGAKTIDVALESGYATPEAFARAFKRVLGQTPGAFRAEPRWEDWRSAFAPLDAFRSTHMPHAYRSDQVRIVDFPATPVASLLHRGDPRQLGGTIRRFIDWRREHRLPPARSATFNVLHTDEIGIAPDDFRFELCAATDRDVAPNDYGVESKTLPAGRCALLRHVGSDATLRAALAYLYGEWLPASGEEPRDFPPFLERVTFFPEVPEHEAVTDIYLPLAERKR
jgi:AraC family transcriptional regulator